MKQWKCSRCNRRFNQPKDVRNHLRDTHKGEGEALRVVYNPSDDGEPSMADRAIQAQLDKNMGIYNFDQEWLLP